jgi:LCP family protein required for cell wall assembly
MAGRKSDAESTKTLKKKKTISKRQKQRRKLLVFGVEVLCLLLLLGILYVWSLWSKISVDPEFTDSEAGINEDLGDDTLLKLEGYTNIAIFGLDNRGNGNYDQGNSDVIMIASINNDTKEVKLVSVYRDTYLNVGKGKYSKANSAYSKGGAKQAVQMLNTNLDLNIKEYMCVDWAAVVEAIDALEGVEIEITEQERKMINDLTIEIDYYVGSNTSKIKEAGVQNLTGAQATAYARIRKTAGNDFKRSSRQRIVLEAMLNKAKQSDVGTLLNICNAVFDDVSTSLTLNEIIGLARHVKEYSIGATTGFPFEMTTKQLSGSGDTVVPIGLEDDVAMLHEYMFGVTDYEASKTVQAISDAIINKTGVTEDYKSINVDEFNNTAGQDGTVFEKEESTEAQD